jgi:hypothetical protein
MGIQEENDLLVWTGAGSGGFHPFSVTKVILNGNI